MCSSLLFNSSVIVLSVTTLFLLCSAFSTDFWVVYTVDRDKIKEETKGIAAYDFLLFNDGNYFSRHRGLFRICYKGNETFFLDGNDGNCLTEKEYEWSPRIETSDWGFAYHQRKHLMRAHLIVMAIAIFTTALASVCAVLSSFRKDRKTFVNSTLIFIGVTTTFVITFIMCFHIYRNLEKNEINEAPFEKFWSSDTHLKINARADFGFSFYLAWLGFGTWVVTLILSIFSKMKKSEELRRKRRKTLEAEKMHQEAAQQYPVNAYLQHVQGPVTQQVHPLQKVTIVHHYSTPGRVPGYQYHQRQPVIEQKQHARFFLPENWQKGKNYIDEYALMDIQ